MKSWTFGPNFRCLWFWTVQDTTQPEELLAGFTGLESSGSGTGLTSPAAPWDFCTKINTLHLCSSQYATFTFSIMHLICHPLPPAKFSITFVFHFSWVLRLSKDKLKTILKQMFFFSPGGGGGSNNAHYGKCEGGVIQNHPCPRPPPRVNPRAFDLF